jgi:hypothetical protein
LYISVHKGSQKEFCPGNTSNAVYLPRGLLFDSKIKQLRNKRRARRGQVLSNAVPVTARAGIHARVVAED